MKVNPISFGQIYKVVSDKPVFSAYKIADMINDPLNCDKKDISVLAQLAQIVDRDDWSKTAILDKKCYGLAQVIAFDNGRNAYLVTGEESRDLNKLRQEKTDYVEKACRVYQNNPQMVSIVASAEEDRFIDLARLLVSKGDTNRIQAQYDEKTDRVNSVKYLA